MPNDADFISFRLSATDVSNLDAITAALIDPVTRPRVSISEAVRTALRVAAVSLTTP
jgi:RNA:NAD 2'-phosphotransferase (TPT1/KptA family)